MTPITSKNQQTRSSETRSTSGNLSVISKTSELREKIGRLILKSRLACSLPSLDPEKFALAIEAWCEVLECGIPESRLDECYLVAMRQKDSNFALGAPDLLSAWRAIQASQRYKQVVKPAEAPCPHCDDERMEEIWFPSIGQTFKLPCFYCRREASDKAKSALLRELNPPVAEGEGAEVAAEPTMRELEAQMRADLRAAELALKPFVYLASPYSHPNPAVRTERFEAVAKEAGRLMGMGFKVFSPIAHTHPILVRGGLPVGFEFWEDYDRAFLGVSHKLIVLMLEGWQESVGLIAEIKIAEEMGIAIQYWEPEL